MKVSAIVSAYFAEAYIEGRLENLIAQQPRPQIIVACKEGSEEEKVSSRLLGDGDKLITTNEVPTIYAAWNIGIKSADGEYIVNANSDDRHYSGALRKQAEVLDANQNIAVSYFDADVVDKIGGHPVGRYEWLEGGILELLRGCFLGPMPMWRKSLHDKHGYFDADMHSAGDYEFWMRIAKAGERFQRIPQALGSYLARDDSAERRHRLRSVWEQARAKSRYREGVGIWQTPTLMTD